MSDRPLRVAILGGGMAGLAAAWRLSRRDGPGHDITVYQRGHRLGGKAASSRGPNGRIEEHGLHVWLGYYENAFAMLRACYDELDRGPACPVRTWRDAFSPISTIGVGSTSADGWDAWTASFPENDLLPGEGAALSGPTDLADHLVGLLATVGDSLGERGPARRAVLSTSAQPPARSARGLLHLLSTAERATRAVLSSPAARDRATGFADLVAAVARGVISDDLVARGYSSIDHLDMREWLGRHGAGADAVDGPFVSGLYDLVFGYRRGDRTQPAVAAGTALALTNHLWFDYRGALFWRMHAGMGDVVIAPLYQALVARGVRFEFFHRLDEVVTSADGRRVERIRLSRQVDLARRRRAYEPLVEVAGLSVFPDRPVAARLARRWRRDGAGLEHDNGPRVAGTVQLEAGEDFDAAVLAVSAGALGAVCPSLVESSESWRTMQAEIGTVATQAFQVWMREDERSLGWRGPAGTVTGVGEPFATFGSFSHTIGHEAWPADDQPKAAAAFCAVLPDEQAASPDPHETVRQNAERFLSSGIEHVWPGSHGPDGFRWDLLSGAGRRVGPDRFGSQFWRANTDPSDRYVQSVPGTQTARLRADGSGVDGLVLAGDWIDSGLNAGCIEAAVLSGLQAANVVEREPISRGITGFEPVGSGP